jgi:hypothetical protein
VNGTQEIDSSEKFVSLNGSGLIQAAGGAAQIELFDVTVRHGANITAVGLVIEQRLALQGGSQLAAVDGGNITLLPDVTIEVAAVYQQLPKLDLGNVGINYSVVPSELRIDIPEGTVAHEELEAFSRPVISGRTLNCQQWKLKVALSDEANFQVECETTGSGGRLLALPEVSLVIKGKKKQAPSATTPAGHDSGHQTAIIVGVCAGVVVVVVIVLVVVVVSANRREKQNREPLNAALV